MDASAPITAQFIVLRGSNTRYSHRFRVPQLAASKLLADFEYVARTILITSFPQHPERDKIIGFKMQQGTDTYSCYFVYNKKLLPHFSDLDIVQRDKPGLPFVLTPRLKARTKRRLAKTGLSTAAFIWPWNAGTPALNEEPPVVVLLGPNTGAVTPRTGYFFYPTASPARGGWLQRYRQRMKQFVHIQSAG